jgi:hypothetical protein
MAALARWTSVDPMADADPEWSPYNYVVNNPLSSVDPNGLECKPIEGGIKCDNVKAEDIKEISTFVGQDLGQFAQGGQEGGAEGKDGDQHAQGPEGQTPLERHPACQAQAGGNPIACAGAMLEPAQPVLETLAMIELSVLPMGDGVGVLGAARKGVQANRAKGLLWERIAARRLTAQGVTILASHVAARTSKGLRIIDHLAQLADGTLVAIEAKAGLRLRTVAQLAKDAAMETEGAVLVGKNASGELLGKVFQLKTIVVTP